MSLQSARRIPFGAIGLLAGLALSVAALGFGLADVVKGLDPAFDVLMGAVGLAFGWAFAGTRLRRLPAGAILLAAAVGSVIIRVGGLEVHLIRAAWDLGLSSALRWPDPARLSNLSPLVADLQALGVSLSVLGSRVGAWAASGLRGDPFYDPVAAATVWGSLIWVLAAWAGWCGRREERPLLAVLPGLITLLAAEAYAAGPVLPIMLALVGMLTSLAFGAQAPVERRALSSYVDLPEGLALQLARLVLPLAVTLALLGAAAPDVSLETWIEQYRSWRQAASQPDQGLARSLGVESGRVSGPAGRGLENPGLPNRHLIGSGPELSHEKVMEVTVKPIAGLPSPPPYYWRTATYDQYTGHGWQTSTVTRQAFLAGEQVQPTLPIHHVEVRQAVHFLVPQGGKVFTAGGLIGMDHDFVVAWRTPGLDAFGVTATGGDYDASSAWPVTTPQELRQAAAGLPPWMQARYVRLPDGIPAEVIGLARDLTATQPTVYDRALAIESYLRTFPYTLDVPQPPIDGDIVDYFLFDLKTGYCDYYASAMVVLARAAGIPARIAVGYASGQSTELQDGSLRYVVTAADAHTWVEVYFPAYGWVPFEPTAGRPPLERGQASVSSSSTGSPGGGEAAGGAAAPSGLVGRAVLFLFLTLAVAGGLGSMAVLGDQVRLRRMPPAAQVHRLMARTRWLAGQWLKVPLHVGDTPQEFQARARTAILRGAQGEPARSIRRRAQSQLDDLVSLYVETIYGPEQPGRSALSAVRSQWIGLALKLIWLGLVMRFPGQRSELLVPGEVAADWS
jgi:transglutaminase-like putative cysteine protease